MAGVMAVARVVAVRAAAEVAGAMMVEAVALALAVATTSVDQAEDAVAAVVAAAAARSTAIWMTTFPSDAAVTVGGTQKVCFPSQNLSLYQSALA